MLPFYKQLSIIKLNQAFQGYAVSYKAELIEKKDPILQLEASKLSIKGLFEDLSKKQKVLSIRLLYKFSLKNANLIKKLNSLQFILIQ